MEGGQIEDSAIEMPKEKEESKKKMNLKRIKTKIMKRRRIPKKEKIKYLD